MGDEGLVDAQDGQLQLVPVHQLQAQRTQARCEYRTDGDDPQFELRASSAAALPAPGWYLLTMRFGLDEGAIVAPCLYPDYGGGYSEALRIALAEPSAKGRSDTVVLIGSPLRGLRFDPTESTARFSLDRFRLRRISRPRAVWEMLRGIQRATRALLWEDAIAAGIAFARDAVRGQLMAGGKTLLQRYRRSLRQGANSYQHWMARFERREDRPREPAAPPPQAPLISIVLPVRDPPLAWLRRCIDSVIGQSYPYWQLCIADDVSHSGAVKRALREYAARDSRIQVHFRENHGHICEASNSAIELACGDYLGFLDHDDELGEEALAEMARAIQEHPEAQLLYSDEDKIDESGRRTEPNFKPAWNPDLLRSQNYICHFTVIRTELVRALGGLRPGYEGAQDHDLLLRCAERLQEHQIVHIPRVLYHWRISSHSTAQSGGNKSYALEAGRRAIEDHLGRTGVLARVEITPHGYYRTVRELRNRPLVSLIVPTRDRANLLRTCLDSVLVRTAYRPFEVLVMDNGSSEPEALAYLDELRRHEQVRVIARPGPFNFSAIINDGVRNAAGSVLCLLNNDTEVIAPDWLDEMVSHAIRKEVGAVGGMLYYPGDTIQHAGVILGVGGVAGHAHGHLRRGSNGYLGRAGVAHNMAAVTGACLAIRREVFEEVGGMDESLAVAFNDVDLCLRVSARGYRNVWTPFAELYHHESASRGAENTVEKRERFRIEAQTMLHRWGETLLNDPAYNPNLSLDSVHFELAFPPRSLASRVAVGKCWTQSR
ncbi:MULTISPECIES: glycosyltransferase family 2 protein [Lysobacter]|uniref:Glycosyltransferase family 2 protein n=1 Tax=Lysobacter gummosus TaxID=262324 RepID=A0ABY3X8P1_9GAMM|nr:MULTISPECIES: glycosyltransferase family 2 protein [Lysobacter]ALN92796.1 glycosyl transferase 2 family protein [Lysobacter gummosus]UJB20391.1 glycosyltransferase family 2 protein [Lysobacter capsici]UJQ30495.1 glycosyltransferase family 2 protein [Lysobacter gummosus]UNP28345.1 glycosyltransferase family 2 protein [Lysobacter gummosus]